jgi:hypothetical protein
MELDPRYVDVIVRRWQDWTGKAATRETDGVAFDDLVAEPAWPGSRTHDAKPPTLANQWAVLTRVLRSCLPAAARA